MVYLTLWSISEELYRIIEISQELEIKCPQVFLVKLFDLGTNIWELCPT